MTFDLNTLKVGQEVAIAHSGSWNIHYYFGYEVVSISPKRTKIVVKRVSDGYERTFSGAGRECGAAKYHEDSLHTNVAELRLSEEVDAARRQLAHEVNNIGSNIKVGERPSAVRVEEALREVEARIAAARSKLADLVAKTGEQA